MKTHRLRHRYGRAKATCGRRVVLTIDERRTGLGFELIGEIRDVSTGNLLKRGEDRYHFGMRAATLDSVRLIAKKRGYVIVEA